jgi:filamentous hemagglutinin family protein
MPPQRRTAIWLAVSTALAASGVAHAQIRTDGTLGPAQALAGPNFAIPASLGQQAGANLFHSFAQFGVPTGGSATFSGPNGIGNIISRVTGADPSSINGTLALAPNIHGANLFLINPRGIVFGPNASLDLGGSFYASTANYLKFADGTRFDATATAPPVLSMAAPAAFGFLGPSAAPIAVQGSALVPGDGAGLALVGGLLTVTGAYLQTYGGDLRLAAAGSAGEIAVDAAATPSAGMRFADVRLTGAEIRSHSSGALAPGRLVIRGGQIVAEGSTIRSRNESAADAAPMSLIASGDLVLTGADMFTETHGVGRGADVLASGANVRVNGATFAGAWTTGTGQAGDFELRAQGALRIETAPYDPGFTTLLTLADGPGRGGALRLTGDAVAIDGSVVQTYKRDRGDGGNVLVQARDLAVVNGGLVDSTVESGTGRGGDLQLRAAEGFRMAGIDPYGLLSSVQSLTYGPGSAGDIRVQARDIDIAGAVIGSGTVAQGDSGRVTVDAETIRIRAAGPWFASVFGETYPGSTGNGGTVTLRASRSIEIDGYSPEYDGGYGRTGPNSATQGPGRGPDLVVESPHIVLDNAAQIGTASYAAGDAGNILVRTHDIEVRSGTLFASVAEASATGRSGDIRIEGTGRLTLATGIAKYTQPGRGTTPADTAAIVTRTEGGSASGNIFIDIPEIVGGLVSDITTQSGGYGNSGNITIGADRIRLTGAGVIRTEIVSSRLPPDTGAVTPGAITINARESFVMSEPTTGKGGIFATSATLGPAGSVTINTPRLTLDGFYIDVTTTRSPGGSIGINADTVVLSRGAAIWASTIGSGNAGNVDIRARTVRLDGGSEIGAQSSSSGRAGSIRIEAAEALEVFGNSLIRTDAPASDGGNIDIRAGNLVHLRNSEITTAVGSGAGAGGNIFIDPTFVILESSRIVANAFGGPGGNIRIIAQYLLSTPDSLIDASSRLGASGSVQIAALNTNLANELATLPVQVLDASAMLRDSCTARFTSGGGSSLVGVGRGGLAASPERFAPSSYLGASQSSTMGDGESAPIGLRLRTAQRARLIVGCPA